MHGFDSLPGFTQDQNKLCNLPFIGEKGNFEPLRDFVEPGKGENGMPHHTNPDQKDLVDKTIEEYGKLKFLNFEFFSEKIDGVVAILKRKLK